MDSERFYVLECGHGFVQGENSNLNNCLAYSYTRELGDAKIFPSVQAALKWLEHAAFNNGHAMGATYNGNMKLVRVERTEHRYTYRRQEEVE